VGTSIYAGWLKLTYVTFSPNTDSDVSFLCELETLKMGRPIQSWAVEPEGSFFFT
jgi:hypothetical protein